VLLDAAVGIVRAGHAENVVLERLAKAGATVLAHDDALRRRAVNAAAAGATAVDLDAIADLLTVDVDRAVWW
jgi:hypothetical protein